METKKKPASVAIRGERGSYNHVGFIRSLWRECSYPG